MSRKGGNMKVVDIAERTNGSKGACPIPFPPVVVEELVSYQRQIKALVDAQMAFLKGALTVLGVAVGPNVNVDLDNYTYTVKVDGSDS